MDSGRPFARNRRLLVTKIERNFVSQPVIKYRENQRWAHKKYTTILQKRLLKTSILRWRLGSAAWTCDDRCLISDLIDRRWFHHCCQLVLEEAWTGRQQFDSRESWCRCDVRHRKAESNGIISGITRQYCRSLRMRPCVKYVGTRTQ